MFDMSAVARGVMNSLTQLETEREKQEMFEFHMENIRISQLDLRNGM